MRLLISIVGMATLLACHPSDSDPTTPDTATDTAPDTAPDTSTGPVCGDNACNGEENSATCPDDCGSSCGDGACNGQEDAMQCIQDCMGPLTVSTKNSRYFVNPAGEAVWLTGSHTWDNRQDWGGPVTDFNYDDYLDMLEAHGHNFIRLWVVEGTDWGCATNSGVDIGPTIYKVKANKKFDLNTFNNAFFNRLRNRVQDAQARGIYVSVMLFQGWSVYDHSSLGCFPWPYHPYKAGNNANGIDGDPNGDGEGKEVHTLKVKAITDLQEAYVKHTIDTLNDLDNVLWEIVNESHNDSVAWQGHMIDVIRDYEASLPHQHPIGMTCTAANTSNSPLFASEADWISPCKSDANGNYGTNPPANTGDKVILSDNDHITNVLGSTDPATYRNWIWKSFLRGHNVLLMDAIQNPLVGLEDHPAVDLNNAGLEAARAYLGDVRSFTKKLDLLALTPNSSLSSTGYCLADADTTRRVYQPANAAFEVDLPAGTWTFAWFNPVSHKAKQEGTLTSSGGWYSFDAPFNATSSVLSLSRVDGGCGACDTD